MRRVALQHTEFDVVVFRRCQTELFSQGRDSQLAHGRDSRHLNQVLFVGPRRGSLLMSQRSPEQRQDLFLAFARLATAATQDTGRHGGEASGHHRGRVDSGAR